MSIANILQDVGQFFTAIFSTAENNPGYATQVVTWMSNTPIAMLGLYLFVAIALANVARRFIPGI